MTTMTCKSDDIKLETTKICRLERWGARVKAYRKEEGPAYSGVAPVCFASICGWAEYGGASGEYAPPLHEVAEVVGVPRVVP